jgi:hypothetical protein
MDSARISVDNERGDRGSNPAIAVMRIAQV